MIKQRHLESRKFFLLLTIIIAIFASLAFQALAQAQPRVIAIGDSITEDFAHGGWRGLLANKLAAIGQPLTWVGTRSDVAGAYEAYGGAASCDFFSDRSSFMADTYNKAPTWDIRAALALTSPAIAIIDVGTNNYIEDLYLKTGVISSVTCGLNPASLQRLWDAVLYYPGITGVVITTVEDSWVPDGTESINQVVSRYVADRRAQGKNVCVGGLPSSFAGLTTDRYHLSDSGKEAVASALLAPVWTAIAGTCQSGVSLPNAGVSTGNGTPLFGFSVAGVSNFTSAAATQNPINYREVTEGLKFTMTANRTATAIRFWKVAGDIATSRLVGLYSSTGALLVSAVSSGEPASGWVSVAIPQTALTAGSTYVAAMFSPTGASGYQYQFHAGAISAPAAVAPANAGVYIYHPTMSYPASSYLASGYFVDVDVIQ